MSDFKIIGNADPTVGKEEFYSVNTFLPSVLPFQNTAFNNSFEQPVKWEIYILENGRWRKTKENDKTGKRISYTFLQKSLERKGIRILARRGEDVARLNVTTHPAEKPKIESIELLDKNGQKPKKALSYGQTLKARVHGLHMENHKVYVTLWEDDAQGAGHNKGNEKNIIQTLSGVVKNGKADVDFLLRPSFAKIAKQNGQEEGKTHEYYVTTDFNKDKIASNNVNVNDLEAPAVPFKGKIPVQQPAQPKPKAPVQQPAQPKAKAPATGSSTAPKVKAEITRVHITNAGKQPIKGVHKEKEIMVWIDSQGLIGKEIRFKLYDEDYLSNDLLVDQKFTITSNIFPITVHLDKILRSKGGISGEGAEQELFADVEVIQTKEHTKSAVVDVDVKVFKPDPVESTNKVAKVGEVDKSDGKGSCGEKFCIKKNDKSELIREINIRLSGFGGNVPTDQFTDRTEKMIKQFQRDYMKVAETGKICGNVLRAIDEFQAKYVIHFDDIKCKCKKCKGFGNGLYKSVYAKGKPKEEAYHNYEYPGIHRSLVWAIRAIMFYASVKEKDLGYTVRCIFSGYRCWEDNKLNGRTTTNHMGKALDIHFNRKGSKVNELVRIEEIRDKILVPYSKVQIRWKDDNLFSVEPSRKSYPKEFIATTWIHIDVREFSSKYLEDKFFAKTLEETNGKNLVQLAKDLGFADVCKCMSNGSSAPNPGNVIKKSTKNNFTIEDAERVLKIINKKYGKEMARNVEMMYRWECDHFRSGQYINCGAPGMEVSEGAKAPEYGWNGDLYDKYPEFTPIGLWEKYENPGKSGKGGNKQVTDKKKKYIVFPSVEAGMHYVAEFILRHNGNIGRWHSLTDKTVQKNYIKDIESTIPRISNKF